MTDFTCDFLQPPKPFPHFWEHTAGSGHAPLALRADVDFVSTHHYPTDAFGTPGADTIIQLQDMLQGMMKGEQGARRIWKNDAAMIIISNLAMPRHPIQTELIDLKLSGALTPAQSLDQTK